MSDATAIAGLVTVAAIHWAQVVPTLKDTPLLGAAFVVLSLACVGLAGVLLVSRRRVAWMTVAIVNTLAVAGYIFTRTVSSFFDNQDVGNWSEALGMVALLVESLLILLSLYRLLEPTGGHRSWAWRTHPVEARRRSPSSPLLP